MWCLVPAVASGGPPPWSVTDGQFMCTSKQQLLQQPRLTAVLSLNHLM